MEYLWSVTVVGCCSTCTKSKGNRDRLAQLC